MSNRKLVVNAKSYNRSKNVLFMMCDNDFRLYDDRFKDNYEILSQGRYLSKNRTIQTPHAIYDVLEDWSLKAK